MDYDAKRRQAVGSHRFAGMRLLVLAALLNVAAPSVGHEFDGIASDCLELDQGGVWYIVNVCDVPVDMVWCLDDDTLCMGNEERAFDSGESVSTGVHRNAPISVLAMACRRDSPFGGLGSYDMKEDTVDCRAPKSGLRRLSSGDDADDSVAGAGAERAEERDARPALPP